MASDFALKLYYAATAVFLLLDLVLGFNIRLAFLDAHLAARLAYYGFCFLCLGLIVWKPAWTGVVSAVESVITLSALILLMAVRVMVPSDDLIEAGKGLVSFRELVNFLIAGTAAYMAYVSSFSRLGESRRHI